MKKKQKSAKTVTHAQDQTLYPGAVRKQSDHTAHSFYEFCYAFQLCPKPSLPTNVVI